ALLSPVHEELGYGPAGPTGYKVMRWFPHSSFTARSRIRFCRLYRAQSSQPSKPRAVLAASKASPGNAVACGSPAATSSLYCGCARRPAKMMAASKRRFPAADGDRELARQHEIDRLRQRSVRAGAATGQEMRYPDDQGLGAAGLGAEQAQGQAATMVWRLVWLGIRKAFDLHQNFSPF